jgi:hypothetical protein
MNQEFNFPVYGTQGGGLARKSDGNYYFVTDPDCPGLQVGDKVPDEWDIVAANSLAREEAAREDEEKDDFDPLHWEGGNLEHDDR